ncbi:MAG: DUF1592 domain-containing protein [Akkermansiaceae bacterium]|jgi:hypothetical protein
MKRLQTLFMASFTGAVCSAEISPGLGGFEKEVAPFFEAHCISCHGPEKSKGKVILHTLRGDLATGDELERWDLIREMLESGEMPPEDEPQPEEAARKAVAAWIDAGVRDAAGKSVWNEIVPTTRRLTNFEYQNTMRDLLGFELKLIDNLSKDPVKPYAFNNSAELMLMGMEQVERYKESARRAMASAIVDPGEPEIHRSRSEWKSHGIDRGIGGDELGVWGNRRNTPATGMGLKSFPKHGEYRIRVKASTILPPGGSEMPLRLVMGYGGLGENQSTYQIETVGTVRLRNTPDQPEVFEFRGRIENHPPRPPWAVRGKLQPESLAITPQNLYDDGTLNDGDRNLSMPRAVIEWIEFEAPVTDVWPPEHHTRILFESPFRESDPKRYVREVLKRFVDRAYRRPATDQEIERFVKIYELVRPDVATLEAAMRETLSMVLISPPFLFHTFSADGRNRHYEQASKLSYFLWGSMPDDELRQLAREEKLDDPAVIEAQVRRLIAEERSKDFVANFTMQWLSLAKMKTVPINQELFPRFLYYVPRGERAGTEQPYRPTIRDYMIEETMGFVAELIKGNASALNFVDSDFAYLNQPLAAHYGVEGVEGNEFRRVAIRPEHRLGGLLTQGSVLIGNGTGSAPHPIYRAVWLREAILGDEVKPPPADVPALTETVGESAEKALTIKDLLAQHRKKESCNDCHARLDPWGVPFEQYNAIGRFQAKVPKEGTRVSQFNETNHKDLAGYQRYLDSINTVEIEAAARVPHGPEVSGMEDLKAYLLEERKNEVAENILRRFLTYSLGRSLTVHDRFVVEELLAQAEKDGYRLQDMIVSICQSPAFTQIPKK